MVEVFIVELISEDGVQRSALLNQRLDKVVEELYAVRDGLWTELEKVDVVELRVFRAVRTIPTECRQPRSGGYHENPMRAGALEKIDDVGNVRRGEAACGIADGVLAAPL